MWAEGLPAPIGGVRHHFSEAATLPSAEGSDKPFAKLTIILPEMAIPTPVSTGKIS
jgi:hypothetical protein